MKRRKPTRLPHYDYASPGAYFVTMCATRRGAVFGQVDKGTVRLNACGRLVSDALAAIPDHHHGALDTSVVMPDHVHTIVVLRARTEGRGPDRSGPYDTLSGIVSVFKARVTRQIGHSVWQRSFYDHVIRDEADLERVREYIETNPARWMRHERSGRDRSRPYIDRPTGA